MAAGPSTDLAPGRPPTIGGRRHVRGTRRRTSPRRRPAPRRDRRARRHGLLGRQLHRGQGRARGPAADRVLAAPVRAGLDDPARAPALARGHAPDHAARAGPAGAARHPRVRHLPDPVDDRARPHLGRRLRGASSRDTGPDRADRGRDRLGHAHAAEARRGGGLVRRGGRGRRRGAGLGLRRRGRGLPPHAARRRLLGDVQRVRRPGPARPLPVACHGLGDGRRHGVPRDPGRRPARRPSRSRRSASRACSRSSTRVRCPRGSPTSWSSTGSASSGRPA